MTNLSSTPLRLRARLRERLDARIEAVPLFNVLLLAVLLTLTGSRFIFAPGVPLVLDESRVAGTQKKTPASSAAGTQLTAGLQLPRSGVPLRGAETSAVLTVKSDTMFIFDGHIYESLDDIFSEKNPFAPPREERGVLLVKLDRAVSVQGLFKIAELAGKAGFSSLQIAGESPSFYPAEKPR